jgi:hypothetical protein
MCWSNAVASSPLLLPSHQLPVSGPAPHHCPRNTVAHGNMPSSASSSSSVYIIGDSSARRPADTDDDSSARANEARRRAPRLFLPDPGVPRRPVQEAPRPGGVRPAPGRRPARVLATAARRRLRVRALAGGRDARPVAPIIRRGALPLRRRAKPARAQRVARHGRVRRDLPLRRRGYAVARRVPALLLAERVQAEGVVLLPRQGRRRLAFTGLPHCNKGWKEGFFFLKSPTPWPCPVKWGDPSKSSTAEPVLTEEERGVVAKLLRANGGLISRLIYARATLLLPRSTACEHRHCRCILLALLVPKVNKVEHFLSPSIHV